MNTARHWLIVAVAFVGLAFSSGPVFNYTFGIFLLPITAAFGWQRGEVSLLFSTYLIAQALCLPVAGRVIDRFGARRVLLPALAGFGGCLCVLGVLPPRAILWYAVFVAVAAVAAASGAVPYAKVLTAWHNRRRGFALGTAAAGVGIGAAIFPLWVQHLISESGWQSAYVSLGLVVLLGGFPIIAAFLHDTPQAIGLRPDGAGDQRGISPRSDRESGAHEALGTRTFWILAWVAGLGAAAILGTVVHLPALLVDAGVSAERAALAAGIIGVASVAGRVAVGWSLDRFLAAHIAAVCFLSVATACVVLAAGTTAAGAMVCAALLGFAIGAEFDIVAYATSRYFSHAHYSQIYGYLFAAFILGSALGPSLMGYGHDATGSYLVPMSINVAIILAAAGLVFWLPSYSQGSSPSDAPSRR